MEKVLLMMHAIVAVLLIIVILLQKSSTDGLKGMGGDGGAGALFSRTSSSNFLTKTTVILALIFTVNCLVLSNLASRKSSKSLLAQLSKEKIERVHTESLPMAD